MIVVNVHIDNPFMISKYTTTYGIMLNVIHHIYEILLWRGDRA
jgi:hypothetical protein